MVNEKENGFYRLFFIYAKIKEEKKDVFLPGVAMCIFFNFQYRRI